MGRLWRQPQRMVLLENGKAHRFDDAYRLARGSRLPQYYRHRRHLDQEVLPDAFSWQVIGERHLEKSGDLSGWVLTKLGDFRYVLEAPSIQGWLVPDPEDASRVRVSPEVLQEARDRFGSMIYSD
jgi:hypothetical protein